MKIYIYKEPINELRDLFLAYRGPDKEGFICCEVGSELACIDKATRMLQSEKAGPKEVEVDV